VNLPINFIAIWPLLPGSYKRCAGRSDGDRGAKPRSMAAMAERRRSSCNGGQIESDNPRATWPIRALRRHGRSRVLSRQDTAARWPLQPRKGLYAGWSMECPLCCGACMALACPFASIDHYQYGTCGSMAYDQPVLLTRTR